MTPSRRQATIGTTKSRFDPRGGGLLRKNMERHRENVARLTHSLRSLGLDEGQVDASVMQASKAYEQLLGQCVAAGHDRKP